VTYPGNYRYTKEHQWVDVQGDTATIGITWYGQNELGDIVYVDLPKIGTRIEAGKTFTTVESVKTAFDVSVPLSGEVIEINDTLAGAPEKLNQDPHGAGWMVKVRVEKNADLSGLLSAGDYEKFAG